MIDKDNSYKELTVMENKYMTNGDDVLTIKRTVTLIDRNDIYKQMKIISHTDENKTDS